jgi:hypothetical protein
VVVCVSLLLVGLIGLLLLNVSLERGAYDLRDQSTRAQQLREQAQKISLEIQGLEAPAALADQAAKYHLVPAGPGVPFLLPDGRTLGVAGKATAPPSPNVSATVPKVTKATTTTKAGTGAATAKARTAPTRR